MEEITKDNYFDEKSAYKLARAEALFDIEQNIGHMGTFDYGFFNTLLFSTVLQTFPIIRIDSALDALIVDTDISEKFTIKIPYSAMFIDKIFKSGDNKYILGIALYDVVVIENWLKTHNAEFENYRIKIDEEDNLAIYNSDIGRLIPIGIEDDSKFSNEMQKTMLSFVEAEVEEVPHGIHTAYSFVTISVANALNLLQGKPMRKSGLSDELTNLDNTDDKDLLKDVIRYVFNVCFLINNHVNKERPASHKNDIRMIPYYPDAKAKRANVNRFSVIKVFGETKQYVDNYNRERRKYDKHNLGAVIVRGHWRLYKHPKYKNMQGKTQWIAPFIKGTNKELYRRIVNIEP